LISWICKTGAGCKRKKRLFKQFQTARLAASPKWNESKEVPVEQRWNDAGLHDFSIGGGALLQLIAAARIEQTSLAILRRADVQERSALHDGASQ
jgi:hypothetical protein